MAVWMLPAATLAAGAMSAIGQDSANKQNANSAREAARFNQQTAREQMAFQRSMSDTAHVREAWDLKQAGMNRILTANKSGASTPGGAAGSQQAAQASNIMEGIQSTAKDAIFAKQQMEKGNAEINLVNSQTEASKTQALKNVMETNVMRRGIPEADLKNDIYDTVKPWIKKLKQGIQSVPDTMKTWRDKASEAYGEHQENEKKRQKSERIKNSPIYQNWSR